MISLIAGKIVANSGHEIVVMTAGGVGFKLAVNPNSSVKWPVGSEVELAAYLAVREDALELYGFDGETERTLFIKFLSVNGIGPKSALHLLTLGTVGEIATAISRGDVDYLTRVSGVGQKTAERIVVELKSKLGALAGSVGTDKVGDQLADIVDGLMALGYSATEAREAVKKIDPTGKSSEQLIREALQTMK